MRFSMLAIGHLLPYCSSDLVKYRTDCWVDVVVSSHIPTRPSTVTVLKQDCDVCPFINVVIDPPNCCFCASSLNLIAPRVSGLATSSRGSTSQCVNAHLSVSLKLSELISSNETSQKPFSF